MYTLVQFRNNLPHARDLLNYSEETANQICGALNTSLANLPDFVLMGGFGTLSIRYEVWETEQAHDIPIAKMHPDSLIHPN